MLSRERCEGINNLRTICYLFGAIWIQWKWECNSERGCTILRSKKRSCGAVSKVPDIDLSRSRLNLNQNTSRLFGVSRPTHCCTPFSTVFIFRIKPTIKFNAQYNNHLRNNTFLNTFTSNLHLYFSFKNEYNFNLQFNYVKKKSFQTIRKS